jgi:formate/nitrite transporter FocA (FNT family)
MPDNGSPRAANGGWLVTSSQDTLSRIFVIILVTSIIGLAGLHHCIVGSIEVFAGLISDNRIPYMDYLKFQVWATIGNVFGGGLFVAILKYSNVRMKEF